MITSHNDPTAPTPVPQPISAATARRRHGAGALLVDIRPQVARHQGSITGALLIDPAAIANEITDRGREIVVCSVSSRRAIPAAEQLSRLGYDRVAGSTSRQLARFVFLSIAGTAKGQLRCQTQEKTEFSSSASE